MVLTCMHTLRTRERARQGSEMRGERPPQYLKSVRPRARACELEHACMRACVRASSFHTVVFISRKTWRCWLVVVRLCVDPQTGVLVWARTVCLSLSFTLFLLSFFVVSTAIGGRTSLSSFPMGTIPHGIYNNNGHERGRRVDLYLPVGFSFFFHVPSPVLFVLLSSSLFFPVVFPRSFLHSVSPPISYFLFLFLSSLWTASFLSYSYTRDSHPRKTIMIPRVTL